MYVPQKMLVTGGCGFIGSNFINYMMETHQLLEIWNLDAMYYCSSINNLEEKTVNNARYHLIRGNLTSYDLILHILSEHKIDTVIHFAAQSHVDRKSVV